MTASNHVGMRNKRKCRCSTSVQVFPIFSCVLFSPVPIFFLAGVVDEDDDLRVSRQAFCTSMIQSEETKTTLHAIAQYRRARFPSLDGRDHGEPAGGARSRPARRAASIGRPLARLQGQPRRCAREATTLFFLFSLRVGECEM